MNEQKHNLITEYIDVHGGTLSYSELQDLDEKTINNLISLQTAEGKNKEDLLSELSKLGGNSIEYEDSSNAEIQLAINFQERMNSFNQEIKDNVYISDMKSEDTTTVSDDISRFKAIKEREGSLPVETEDSRYNENQALIVENRLRDRLGLQEKQLLPLSSDLELLIDLDGGKIGSTCKEWLLLRNKEERGRYKKEMVEIINLRLITEKQRNDEILFLAESWEEVEQLQTVPQKLVAKGKDQFVVNPLFKKHVSRVKKLKSKIDRKLKALEAIERNMNIPQDRRQSIFHLQKRVTKMLEDSEH